MHLEGWPGMTLKTHPFWDLHFLGLRTHKKPPFYSARWKLFAYFPFPSNEYLYPWGKLVGYAFSGATKKTKNKKIHCKMEIFLHIFHPPAMNISTPGANLWDMHFLEPPKKQNKINFTL